MEFLKKKDDELRVVRIVLITAGLVLAAAACFVVIYKVVKKHFKITFECEDCDFTEDDCYGDEDDGFAPEFVCDSCGDACDSASDDIFDEIESEQE